MDDDRKATRRIRLKLLMDTRFEGKQVALANRVGVIPNLISRYIRGAKGIGEDMRDKIEDACGLPRGWLDAPIHGSESRDEHHAGKRNADEVSLSVDANGGEGKPESNVAPGPDIKGRVPLISWVQAGMWNEAVDIYEPGYAEDWLSVLKNGSPHTYALRVQGDSMTSPHGKTYPDGSIIIVDPEQRSPTSGQRIIAKLVGSNAVTFKVYVEEDGQRWLKPLNQQHRPIYDEFRVLGTVTAKYEPE